MESVMSTVIDVLKSKINTSKKVVIARLAMCIAYCVFGFFMTCRVNLKLNPNLLRDFFCYFKY